ncbi:MAG: hypothetical protein ACUVQY_05740 [Thermoproteota archaeon]
MREIASWCWHRHRRKPTGAPRTLTILAKTIEIKDQAEITYDLDNPSGLDPDTPAPPMTTTASGGANGSSASGEGSYPLLQMADPDDQECRERGA